MLQWKPITSGADGAMPAKPDPVVPSAMPFAWLEFLDNLWDTRSEFRYVERGKMASMGMWGGVADLTKSEITPVGGTLTGVTAFASWRGAYLSKQVSVQNMILIPMFWYRQCRSPYAIASRRWRRVDARRVAMASRARWRGTTRRRVASRRWRGGRGAVRFDLRTGSRAGCLGGIFRASKNGIVCHKQHYTGI